MNADTVPAVSGIRGIPLAEMAELPPDLLARSLGNVIPDETADPVPVSAFQSAL